MTPIAHTKLPLVFDSKALRKEVEALLNQSWKSHMNTYDYIGEWEAVALRSPGGSIDNIVPDDLHKQDFLDTALMEKCPTILNIVNNIKCPVFSVRLLNLKSGSIIKEHKDADLCLEKGEARLHIPVITNDQVKFVLQGERVVMNEGECWYINASLPHSVKNTGEDDRIHLVIDLSVNQWLTSLFDSGIKTFAKPDNDDIEMTKNVIKELRLQNSAVANKLADDLQEQFHLND